MERLIAEIKRLAEEKTWRSEDERARQQAANSNIPIRVPIHFMGREDALAAIEAALTRLSQLGAEIGVSTAKNA
jgi:hypothetical protein